MTRRPALPEPPQAPAEIPSRWHRCERMSREHRTRHVDVPAAGGVVGSFEVCPCGGHRTVIGGGWSSIWLDRNTARRRSR